VWRTIVGATTTVKTHYVFDPAGHLLAEHDGATGAVQREYVWLDDMPLAMIDSTGPSPVTYYIHTGQIEEPLLMTDAAKAKVWDAYVEPFGQAQVFGTPSAGLDLRLPGQFAEYEASGLFQNWHRNYDPSLGRYIEADPLGIEAGQNLYAYVDGAPLDDEDVAGLDMNLFPKGDAYLYGVSQLRPYPNMYTVKAHGNVGGVFDQNLLFIEPKDLALRIKRDPTYHDTVVILAACNVGRYSYAQELANHLRRPVVAPTTYVAFRKDGKPYTGVGLVGLNEKGEQVVRIGRPYFAWRTFYPK
jgi:RHS repeat-associated protein